MSSTPTEDRMIWRGVMATFLQDETRLIDLEGAFRSSKTTACLRKVAKSCLRYPGIHWWINRYADGDTQRQLKPQWRVMLDRMGMIPEWDANEHADVFSNGSKVYVFGIKAQDQLARYSKIRGLTLAGIYNDQSEELPHDIFQEFNGRLSQQGFPHQLLLSPNPPDENHWLAKDEFREGPVLQAFAQKGTIYEVIHGDGSLWAGRHYYSVPIYANAHNLPQATIEHLEQAYPRAHPKYRPAVLGLRGLNVIGQPVYAGSFRRELHVGPVSFNPAVELEEALDFGHHHPCIVWRQRTPFGGIVFLGGILGQDMPIEDFIPAVVGYRTAWFGRDLAVLTCCDPAGAHDGSGRRDNVISYLRSQGFTPRWLEDSNRPAVRVAMIERLMGLMRRRTPQGEALRIEERPERWVLLSGSGRQPSTWTFLADAFEAGYVWDPHDVSVDHKPIRRPKKDGWYDHGMNCAEYLEHNFGSTPDVKEESVVDEYIPESAWS